MGLKLSRIKYNDLNSKQKENYNFQKISAILADYGFITHRLSDDWKGADFIAQHINGEIFLKVQLKGRLSFNKKYCGKDLHIAFPADGSWYLYPHDEVLQKFFAKELIEGTEAWFQGEYHFSSLTKLAKELIEPYRILVV